MPIISSVGLFCCDKFEETPNEEVINLSKLTKSHFSFLMNDAFTGSQANIYVEAWRQFLDKTVTIESKAVPGHYWQTDSKEGFLQVNGELFK